MPALFVFLLKVNIALVVFCLGYYLVLRRLTFYTLNRAYLCVAIIFSTLYPLVNLDGFAQRHRQLTPVQNVIMSLKAPAERIVNPIIQQPNYWYWAEALFWAGAALFALRLFMQLASLYKLYRNSKPGKVQEHDVRIINADISPFSFWQSIYINPENLNPGDLQSIIQHEQVHITEWHTLDILLAEISVIFYWFNPGVWLMKKAVRENIEFITDRKILQKGMDSKTYQYSLLNVSFTPTTSAGITNHFNFSTLKKRIKMMNAKRSSNVNLTRYAFLVPAVLICLFAFSLSKAELVKKSKIAYKTITTSVANLTPATMQKTVDNMFGKISPNPVTAPDTQKKTLTFVTVTTNSEGKSDTGKKASYTYTIKSDSIKTFVLKEVRNDDSTIYSVNGKKVTEAEFKKITRNDLGTAFFMNGKKPLYLSFTTKDGPIRDEAGKAITIIGKDGHIGKVQTIIIKDGQGMEITSDGELTHNGQTITSNGKPVTVKGFKINSLSTNERNNEQKTVKVEGEVTYPGNYTIKKDLNIPDIVIRAGGLTQSANVDESLVIVDGKEVSKKDMKKLSVDDIKGITIKNGSDKEMRDKYGDKAKNGVLIITTKKAK